MFMQNKKFTLPEHVLWPPPLFSFAWPNNDSIKGQVIQTNVFYVILNN